jgi:hypothetical protein
VTVRASALLRLCAALAISGLATPAVADSPACAIPQSPRSIDRDSRPSPYDATAHTSIVRVLDPDSIEYSPRAGGPPTTLFRCGQHYHLPIEAPQGCRGEVTPGEHPKPGSWVELHTVYASQVRHDGCNPETLECCQTGPFLVRAFAARVTAQGPDTPILPPPGLPLAEWSGSTTGADKEPEQCKPAAQWSFRLGCDFTVSEAQLHHFRHADPARPVQPSTRLSHDLTLVVP